MAESDYINTKYTVYCAACNSVHAEIEIPTPMLSIIGGADYRASEANNKILELCPEKSVDDLKQLIHGCYDQERYYYVGETLEQRCHDRRSEHIKNPKELFKGRMHYTLVDDRFEFQEKLIKFGKETDKVKNKKLCLNSNDKYDPKEEVKRRGEVYVVVLDENWETPEKL